MGGHTPTCSLLETQPPLPTPAQVQTGGLVEVWLFTCLKLHELDAPFREEVS